MIVSKCCQHPVEVHHANDYGDYYACGRCFRSCDTMTRFNHKEDDNAEVFTGIVLEAVDVPY